MENSEIGRAQYSNNQPTNRLLGNAYSGGGRAQIKEEENTLVENYQWDLYSFFFLFFIIISSAMDSNHSPVPVPVE